MNEPTQEPRPAAPTRTSGRPDDVLDEARRAYLQLTRLEQAEFWRWIRSGEADVEAAHG